MNGYHIESELDDISKSGYHKSPLGYDNVDCFVIEVIKLENKMAIYFKDNCKLSDFETQKVEILEELKK